MDSKGRSVRMCLYPSFSKCEISPLIKFLAVHKKKNEVRPPAATWMDLEIAVLSEVSQTEKDRYHMISLICET